VVAIADMWKRLNIETKPLNTDAKTHFAHLRDGGDFDVARYGWIGDYSDPQNFLFLLESDNKGFNYGKYSNPEYDGPDEAGRGRNRPQEARRSALQGGADFHARPALDPDHALRQQAPHLAEALRLYVEPSRGLSDSLSDAEAVSARESINIPHVMAGLDPATPIQRALLVGSRSPGQARG
jgi:hypothetical protein